MPDFDLAHLPLQADRSLSQLEALIERIVELTIAKVHAFEELLGVSPEHLCAMRAKGQGPQWSGDGKWIRYRRSEVIRWLDQLPTNRQAPL